MLARYRLAKWTLALSSLLAAVACEPATLTAAPAADEVDYVRDIKPMLAKHCYACHGSLKQESDLRLDTVEFMRSGGASGPAIAQRGSEASSEILARVRNVDAAVRMPPDAKPLTEREVAMLEVWLTAGAPAPEGEAPQSDPMEHWSFRAPQPRELPDNGAAHPIDRFLTASAARVGVVPLAAASRRDLLRRVTLDLIGLPPNRQELAEFLNDESPRAYEQVVDRLLQRPEYGARWGRHWMDVWRYSDWYGRRAVPDVMNSYPQIWRWRDWIVRSLNEDKGYDRMVIEMLAADEVSPTDDQNLVATGFIVRNWFKWNYETWMKDNVEHTGKAFLGLTFNCAQCHDHKFDPITQEDYFRFRAFFEPLELRHERVAGGPDPGPFKKYKYAESYGPIQSGAIRIFDEKLDAQTFMFNGGDARNRIEGRPPVDAGPPRAFTPADFQISEIGLPPEASYPGLKEFVRREELAARQAEIDSATSAATAAVRAAAAAADKLAQLRLQSAQPVTAAATRPAPGSLLAVERERFAAQLAAQVAESARQLAVARSDSLRARIAADDAAQRASGDAGESAELANLSEKQVAYYGAQHAALLAEQSAIQAERVVADTAAQRDAARNVPVRNVSAQKDAAAKVEPAKDAPAAAKAATTALAAFKEKLHTARAALDAARSQLTVSGSTYTALSPKYPTTSTGRRSALARWIVADTNPLAARVAVNHMWLRHFGQPLVESVDNFGIQGKSPVHPELLDWLAIELTSHGWSMKHLHRLIVTSAAYQRSSSSGSAEHPNHQLDRDNTTYWRYPPRRMESEVVRDSVLACAGALDSSLGGPEIDVANWIATPRRSLHFTQHGEAQMLFLDTFDGANVSECYRRTSTVLPSQALAMANSELLVHYGRVCAAHLSDLLAKQNSAEATLSGALIEAFAESSTHAPTFSTDSNVQFTQLAFETLLGRGASDEELSASLSFLDQQQAALLATQGGPEKKSTESSESTKATSAAAAIRPPAADALQRARENLLIALFNHNDFITIR